MDESPIHKPGLYKWQRQTKSNVQSRTHKVKSSDDISDWIQKVENASVKATDMAFGLVEPTGGRRKGKAVAQAHTRQARFEEEAHSEAQDLLRQWVIDKVHFDADDGYDDLEAWRRARHQQKENADCKENKRLNKHVEEETAADILNAIDLDDYGDWDVDEAAIYQRVKKAAFGEEDPYSHLYDMDETEAVSSVLKTLMAKDVVKDAFKKDLGVGEDSKSVPDPRTKMELRHQMVKENREKRQKEELKKMKDKQMKKEAKVKAQKMINKEQKDKESQVRKEEEEIKKEMIRLRKEVLTENKKKEEQLRKERDEREAIERIAMEELERQKYAEEQAQMETRKMENDKRKAMRIKHELWRSKQEAKNLKCLHRHFNAWYDLVLSKRLLLGKVKAMSDWKVMVKIWGAWKSHVRGQRAQMASVQHEKEVIESHRKTIAAETHFCHNLLRKYLIAWKYFVKEEVERKELEAEKERTKSKMKLLLNAVAEGKLAKYSDSASSVAESSAPNTNRSTQSRGSNLMSSKRRISDKFSNNTNSGFSNPSTTMSRGNSKGVVNSSLRVQTWVEDTADNFDSGSQISGFTESSNLVNNNGKKNISRPNSASGVVVSSKNSVSQTSGSSNKKNSNLNNNNSNSNRVLNSNNNNVIQGRVPPNIPTEAWQVNKKHTKLNMDEIRNFGQTEDDVLDSEEIQQEFSDVEIRKRFGTQPWMNRHYVVNNFEHRYNAQQKALRQQQEEIKEQKRLIQELQYKQEQQRLHQHMVKGTPSNDISSVAEAPLPGNQIPRDADDIPSKMQGCDIETNSPYKTGVGDGKGPVVIHSNNQTFQLTDGPPTERSEIPTHRTTSDVSKVSGSTHNNKYLTVLKNMEERSAQRARLKAEREEKKRKQEEEKLVELERIEAERLQQEEEEKKARIEAHRQKKRLEKQKVEERQKEAARLQEMLEKARIHYDRSVLKYRGLLPLKKLISLSKRNWNKAVKHHNQAIVRQCMKDWKKFTCSETQRKNELADQMGKFLLIKHCFDRWRKVKYHTQFLLRRADRHYQTSLRCKMFNLWLEWKDIEKAEMDGKMEMAEQYYWEHLLRSRFMAWKDLPEKQKREEERKKRVTEMRLKVAQLIPDFKLHSSVDSNCVDSSRELT